MARPLNIGIERATGVVGIAIEGALEGRSLDVDRIDGLVRLSLRRAGRAEP